MYQFLLAVHVLIALGIVGLVLIQQGRGASAGAAFGSGASGTVFGARGASSFLTRTTAILATLFFSTSLALAYLLDNKGGAAEDIMDTEVPVIEQVMPDVPQLDSTVLDPASDMPVAPAIPEQIQEQLIEQGETLVDPVQ